MVHYKSRVLNCILFKLCFFPLNTDLLKRDWVINIVVILFSFIKVTLFLTCRFYIKSFTFIFI